MPASISMPAEVNAFPKNTKLEQSINSHEKSSEVRQILSSESLLPCPTEGCSNCIRKSEHNHYSCPVCLANKCYLCGGRPHKGACSTFEQAGKQVSSESYPGFANFRSGLSNICYFNSALKMLIKLAGTVENLRIFMNPQKRPLRSRQEESPSELQNRVRLQTSLHDLIETTLAGIDVDADFMCQRIAAVFDAFEIVALHENLYLGGILREDQFDAHQILNLILRSIDFDQSPFMIELDSLVTPEGGTTRSIAQERVDILPLPLTSGNTLQSQLEQMWKAEALDEHNQYYLEERIDMFQQQKRFE